MEAKTTDLQLEYELQDLYLSTKQWLSDIFFISDEIRFFKDVISKYWGSPDSESYSARIHHCKMMLVQLQEEITSLKGEVIAYLNFLGPFISDPDKMIDVDLIEKHSALENEIKTLFESLKLLKIDLFSLTGNMIDEEKNCFI